MNTHQNLIFKTAVCRLEIIYLRLNNYYLFSGNWHDDVKML